MLRIIESVFVLSFLLAGCAGKIGEDILQDRVNSSPNLASLPNSKQSKLHQFLRNGPSRPTSTSFEGFSSIGDGQLIGKPISAKAAEFDGDSRDVVLNLVAVSIPQAAKSVLADVLEQSYTLDPRVSGTVTIQTPNPISKNQLVQLFEAALKDNGAAVVATGSTYRIIPLSEAVHSTAAISVGMKTEVKPGLGPEIIALRYVSAESIREILESMIPPGMVLKTDQLRNALIISGTVQELAAIKETISVFDVDWLRGMSFALVRVRSTSPASIVRDVDEVFQTQSGPLKGIIRFVPNERLRSVLVVSSSAKYLKDATQWIRKIDVLAHSTENGLHVYHVQNRNASDLARVLGSLLDSGNLAKEGAEGRVAPKYDSAVLASSNSSNEVPISGGPETPLNGIDSAPEVQDESATFQMADNARGRVVADDENNALIVYCSDGEFERILSVLHEIDSAPNQVLLEAVIAEVSLDDDLKFGVRWFLGGEANHGGFSDVTTGAISSVFPGFSYFLKANDIRFALNAISSITNVHVLSAPSLVVLDNKTATLQVGDQVPVVTQSAKAVTSGDAPIVTNVELKDTGLILKVTPRVNDSGLVTLDIEQEVSSVIKTTTSGIDSPTIRQRRMKTSVVVNDGESLALGGLIQEKEVVGKAKVPLFGDIPGIGVAFRQKQNTTTRTELVIFIRPSVIRDLSEARNVTDEFRRRLSVNTRRIPVSESAPSTAFEQIFN